MTNTTLPYHSCGTSRLLAITDDKQYKEIARRIAAKQPGKFCALHQQPDYGELLLM